LTAPVLVGDLHKSAHIIASRHGIIQSNFEMP